MLNFLVILYSLSWMKFACYQEGNWAQSLKVCPFIHNNLKRKHCPCYCCTQQNRQSIVALCLNLKFSIIFSISEIPDLVLIYRRWNYQPHKKYPLYLLKTWVCNLKIMYPWNGKGDFYLSSCSDAYALLCVRFANVLDLVLCVARWHRW